MYLIGGFNGTTNLNDVWVSPDKGANRTIAQGVLKGHSRGYYSDTLEVLTVYSIYIDRYRYTVYLAIYIYICI